MDGLWHSMTTLRPEVPYSAGQPALKFLSDPTVAAWMSSVRIEAGFE